MRIRSLTLALLSLSLAAGCGDDGDGTPVDASTDGDTPEVDAMTPTEDAAIPEDGGTEDGGGPMDMGTDPDDMGADTDGCVPTTCEAAGADCGTIDDGCGGTIDCGGDDVCVAAAGDNAVCDTTTNSCECTASTCGANDCGTPADGCGGSLDCGTDCSTVGTNATCNTTTNMCECVANTCGTDECGSIDDGCGGTVDCGTDCSTVGTNATCNTTTNMCECVANTCSATDCSTPDDGCGGSLDCGTDCSTVGTNATCNTTTNTCDCTPDTCGAGSCGTPDDGCGSPLDCGTCTGLGESCNTATNMCEVTAMAPMAGQVLITEVMYDPNSPLSESNAEWIEVLNTTAMPLNLSGCSLADGAGSTTIGSVVIPAGGYLVFARSTTMADNGLPGSVTVAGTFSFGLSNAGDDVTLECGTTTIDTLTYDDGPSWPDASSATLSRDPSATSAAGSNDPANWCLAVDAYYDAGGADEHRGTPGAANPACPVTLPGFCRTQFPETIAAAPGEPTTVFGRVYAAGITDATVMTDPDASLVAELGYGPAGTDASSAGGWTWQTAIANTSYTGSGGEENNDEYQADLAVFDPGMWDYVYRFSIDGGASFLYCNTGAPGTSGSTAYSETLNGELTVAPYGSDDITAIEGSTDGVIDVDVDLVYVTYIKAAIGADPEGFFVQAEPTGPAIFVASDPSGLAVGDGITFTATELTTVSDHRRVTMLSGLTTVTTGFDVETLRQDLSTATDLVSALGDYESELLAVDATIDSAFSGAGLDHLAAVIATAGISGDADLRLRLPTAVVNSTGVRQGCDVSLDGAMWRFTSAAQLSGWVDGDLTVGSCPAPVVTGAVATDANSVVVTFDVDLDPGSVMAGGGQFTIGGLTVSGASVTGSNQVTLTTTAQTGGTDYTVTVAATVTDDFGTGVDGSANTTTFTGFAGAPILLFTEYYEDGGDKAVEISNIGGGPGDLGSCELRLYSNGSTSVTTTGDLTGSPTLSGGDSHVICDTSPSGTLMPSCDGNSGAINFNGDDAIELWCDLGSGLELQDRFGDPGVDPGSSWPDSATACSATPGTEDVTISRLCTVTGGRTASTDFCPADEWELTDSGMDITTTDLGSYNCP